LDTLHVLGTGFLRRHALTKQDKSQDQFVKLKFERNKEKEAVEGEQEIEKENMHALEPRPRHQILLEALV